MNQPERSVDVFAEITCPFTHVGLHRLVAERTRRALAGPRLVVRSWPLELVNGRPLDGRLVAQEVAALRAEIAPDLFRGFSAELMPESSIAAFGLAAAAYQRSVVAGEGVSLAIRRALFEEGLDITDHQVLWKIGGPFSVQPMSTEASIEMVYRDWEEGRRRGAQGSPHFFVDDHAWFCPSLRISHDVNGFAVQLDGEALRDFYGAVFADPAVSA